MESKGGDVVSVHQFTSDEQEATWVCNDILTRYGTKPDRIAILCRYRSKLEPIRDGLRERGVNAELLVRQDQFLTGEYCWLQLMLKLIARPTDAMILSATAESFDGLPNVQVANMGAESISNLAQAVVQQLSSEHPLVPLLTETLSEVTESPECFQNWIADAIEAIRHLNQDSNQEKRASLELDEKAWQEITDDLSLLFGDELELSSFNQEFDMLSKAATAPENSVSLMTIHGAKGLEFNHVYIVGAQDDCLPDFRAIKGGDDSPQMEEERRACFVAITRAENSLTFTYSSHSHGYRKSPSRFLQEMGLEYVNTYGD